MYRTLVNNTLEDGTPYFQLPTIVAQTVWEAVFRFNYDEQYGSQTVANSQSSAGNSINGSSVRASKVIQILSNCPNSTPPASYNLFTRLGQLWKHTSNCCF